MNTAFACDRWYIALGNKTISPNGLPTKWTHSFTQHIHRTYNQCFHCAIQLTKRVDSRFFFFFVQPFSTKTPWLITSHTVVFPTFVIWNLHIHSKWVLLFLEFKKKCMHRHSFCWVCLCSIVSNATKTGCLSKNNCFALSAPNRNNIHLCDHLWVQVNAF